MPEIALGQVVRLGRDALIVVGLVLVMAATVLVLASPAHAATLNVNSTADDAANDG